MTRVMIVETGKEGADRRRRFCDLDGGDWLGITGSASVSVILSILATLVFGGRGWEDLGPAFVIPLMVSIPASVVLFRQRRVMVDLNRQMLDLLR